MPHSKMRGETTRQDWQQEVVENWDFALTDHPSPAIEANGSWSMRSAVSENGCGAGSSTHPHFQEGRKGWCFPCYQKSKERGSEASGCGSLQQGLGVGFGVRVDKAAWVLWKS